MDGFRLDHILEDDMAHFAWLDGNNVATQVIVVGDSDSGGGSLATEDVGIAFCRSLYGQDTNWKQTRQ